MNFWKWSTLSLLAALLTGGSWAAITGGLYPESERAFAYRTTSYRCAVTSANTALRLLGDSNRGVKNLIVRNDGPDSVFVSVTSTTASTVASASFKLPIDQSLALGDFYTVGIGLKCSTAETAAVEVLATY